MNTARLFTYAGTDIWKEPLAAQGHVLTPDEQATLPHDIQKILHLPTPGVAASWIPGWPKDKPFLSSWAVYPRFHPPGDLLLTAPIALLYSFTDLSLSGADRLLIFLFVIYAHVSIYFLLRTAFAGEGTRILGLLGAVLAYGEIVHWTLEGFYEAATIAPLILSAKFLSERRGSEALLAFSAALFLHFRALYLIPYVFYALFIIARDKQWSRWRTKNYVQLAVAAVLSLISGYVFVTLWPQLDRLPINNPVSIQVESVNVRAVIAFLVVMTAICVTLAIARSWVDVAVAAWLTIFLLLFHQAFPWDILTLLAWLGAPSFVGAMKNGLVRDVRLAAIGFIAFFVFTNPLWPSWIAKVV